MGVFALILGMLGAVGGILGIVTATEVLPSLGPAFTWEFWFMLSGILLLGSIASALGRGGGYE